MCQHTEGHTKESLQDMNLPKFMDFAREVLGDGPIYTLEQKYDYARGPIEDAVLEELKKRANTPA